MTKKTVIAPKVLLPNKDVDLNKWAVIACDQFTSQGEYWDKLDKSCGDTSALRLIFPEYYLDKCNVSDRVKTINATMRAYLEKGVFDCHEGFVLTRRTTKYGNVRTGLIAAVSLDDYDFTTGTLKIKATEATVPERLPVRVSIREDALIELPHVLMLIDDDKRTVIEPLYQNRASYQMLYDFDLNMDGGHIEGYLVKDNEAVSNAFESLVSPQNMLAKYGKEQPFMLAVGDGNHSVATAKVLWERIKPTLSEQERLTHPAGYVLVEIVNLYEDSLKFEPIHRVVFGVDDSFAKALVQSGFGEGRCYVKYGKNRYEMAVPKVAAEAVNLVQNFIDEYVKNHTGVKVDYIHGNDNLDALCAAPNTVGVYMPYMQKGDLFSYVNNVGTLPRKTFSMGEAEEKRYYLEARMIVKE